MTRPPAAMVTDLADAVAVRTPGSYGPKLAFILAEVATFFSAVREGDYDHERSPF